jgi:Tetratricopeptide repeat
VQVARRAVALPIFETQMGAGHTHTAWGLHSLAIVPRAQGDLDHAQALFARALAIHEARLGADHPSTLESQKGLPDLTSLASTGRPLRAWVCVHWRRDGASCACQLQRLPSYLRGSASRPQRTTEAASMATRVPPPSWPGVPSERTSRTCVVARLSPLRTYRVSRAAATDDHWLTVATRTPSR